MRVIISGYYGFGNLGDEAVLAAMLPPLRKKLPTAEFTVFSANPTLTARLHNVDSVSRTGLPAIRALNGADLFLSGGGSLLQDVTSPQSALYYLGTLALATARARHTMVFAQGVGPLQRPWIRSLTRWTLERVDLLTVRDSASRELVESLGVRQPIHLVADPVFALEPAPAARTEALLGALPRPRLGIALRSWRNNAFVDALVVALRRWRDQTGGVIVPLAFHPSRDLQVSRRAATAVGGDVLTNLRPDEMLGAIGALDLLIGMRLHALIAAVVTGVPMIGLRYDPKIDALFRDVPIGQVLSLDHLDAQVLDDALRRTWDARQELRASLLRHAATLRAEALRAADLAASLVTGPRPNGGP